MSKSEVDQEFTCQKQNFRMHCRKIYENYCNELRLWKKRKEEEKEVEEKGEEKGRKINLKKMDIKLLFIKTT